VSGQVTSINHFTGKVTIKTEEIPGLEGKNMTVTYAPKDTMALKSLHEGDHVKGDLVISGSDTHMENVVAATAKHDTAKKAP
jgi:Cu/Ag efflux protein CusF